MTFTASTAYTTDLDKVRQNIRDVTENAGPRPGDANFSNEVINGIISDEGSWQRAVAKCFEMLASEWRRYPDFKTDGLSLNRSDIANGFVEAAKEWRSKYGTPNRSYAPVYVTGQIPQDGYSDDITNDDVNTGGDYTDTDKVVYIQT